MNQHPDNLAAWLDDELPEGESESVVEHLEDCAECRERVASYALASGDLEFVRPPSRRVWWWPLGIAAALALAVWLWPALDGSRNVSPLVAQRQPAVTKTAAPPIVQSGRAKVRTARPKPSFNLRVVRVALPAEALFAPGAVPPGVEIYADLVLAADGSASALIVVP